MNTLINLIAAACTFGTVLMFGTLGEVLTEKSGSLNLGVEGLVFMGGAFGLVGAYTYDAAMIARGSTASPFLAILIAVLSAFAAGAVGSLLFSFITITLRANQNVTGLALTMFGTGVAKFTGEFMRHKVGGFVSLSNHLKEVFAGSPFPEAMRNIPVIGKILFNQSIFFYMGILIAILMHLYFKYTKNGLYLRSVGESPVTADAAGINITRYRYIATIIGGGISAVGGMVYVMTTGGCTWNETSLGGIGWLAVALVIFCMWRPLNAIWGSVLFGALMIMYLRVLLPFFPTELYKILPYVVTVVVLIITSIRNSKDKQAPAGLGLNYFREER